MLLFESHRNTTDCWGGGWGGTDPGVDFSESGTPVFVGVVVGQGMGDFGVPGVFGAGVVKLGDVELEVISEATSRHPGVLPPPSLLPDF